ncbi:MAG: polysaccharide deacetylase family protein [Negativicutes bacterium]|nr:polysaccharide deacetylase family protein [Negativicutes bacterium]
MKFTNNRQNAMPPIEYTGTSIPIFMYHEIGTGSNSLYVSAENFRAQMEYLSDNGYHTATMSAAQEMLASKKIPAKTVVLTFDDGYASFYKQAWPIMKEFDFTGTVYLVTELLDRANYLTWEETKTLTNAGIEIGSHTQHHLDLKAISNDDQKLEISNSKKMLEEKLNISVKSFCYPSGSYSEITPQLVKEAGYTSAVIVTYGLATPEDNQFLIPRVRVHGWTNLDQFAGSFK